MNATTPAAGPSAGQRPRVACVIPTHRRDEMLARALESVCGQTRPPGTVVVVDDTASAATADVVAGWQAAGNVRYVDGSGLASKGASASRNLGARTCDSELLAFLDDDDRWRPGFLDACVAELVSSGADLVIAWGSLEVGGQLVRRSWAARPNLTAGECVARNPGMTGSNFVVRREAFEAIGGFDAALPVYNDLDFLVRFLHAGFTYRVVEEELVVQNADGVGHLSSRGQRRARGIAQYMHKHRAGLGLLQRRRLHRDRHLASRYPGQPAHRSLYHFLMMWLHSSPSQLLAVLQARTSRRAGSYS
jgi:glycosyltransferase involved in cell wall biosynthesis